MRTKIKVPGAPAWHVHHLLLMEWCWSFPQRRRVIINHKAPNEIKDRLRLLRKVHPIPEWLNQIIESAHYAARLRSEGIVFPGVYRNQYVSTFIDEFNRLVQMNGPKVAKLHTQQCGRKRRCVWKRNRMRFRQ